ncbi:glutathione hydrolase 6 [Conger conger]|uniref:glutathione hydrolase 6 n=1 Tax=Conger conger TaxID=82655 RepID=UPI002A5A4189|nr:glutathione hydrolase 6 [Conger conger]
MIPKSSVRYERLRTEYYEEPCTDQGNPEDDEEVTVFIAQTLGREHRVRRRSRCMRLSVALLLLLLALGFVVCEWRGCLCDESAPAGSSAAPGNSGTAQEQKGHGHHHDDDHQEGEDHDNHGDEEHHEHKHPNALFHHGVVITDSAICSKIGRGILERGGNAVDAGLASLLCLGVVHPHTTGVGGVFSAILHNRTSGKHRAIRSVSPAGPPSAHGVPAALQGVRELHRLFGCCGWETLFSGAVKLAADGFSVDRSLAEALRRNREEVLRSSLCQLFCDGKNAVKALGSTVANQKLAELLQFVSLNRSRIPEGLALKLAADLPPTERQGFVESVQGCGVEIDEPLIIEEEEYSVYAATSPLSSKILSDVLGKIKEQDLSPWKNADLNSSASAYISLLTAAELIYNDSLAKENRSVGDLLALNPVGSHVGVLDSAGNALVISSSLNSLFGSKKLLPSTGVILSDVSPHPVENALFWSCPLILKLKQDDADDDTNNDHHHHDDADDDTNNDHQHHDGADDEANNDHHHHDDGDDDDHNDHHHHDDGDDDTNNDHHHHDHDDDDDDDEELLAVGVTGGLSAPFLAAQIILSIVRGGKSAHDAVTGPLLRPEAGAPGSLSGCISTVTKGSNASRLLPDRQGGAAVRAGCPDNTLALILQARSGHVGAYGAPADGAHTDGY